MAQKQRSLIKNREKKSLLLSVHTCLAACLASMDNTMAEPRGFSSSALYGISSSDESNDPRDIGNGIDNDGLNNNNNNNDPLSAVISMLSRVLSQERLKLSISDRNAVEEEIHGVRCMAVEETPDLIRDSLQNFQKELLAVPKSTRVVYDRIVSSVKEYRRLEEKLKIHNHDNSTKMGIAWNIPKQEQELQDSSTLAKHYAIEDDDFRIRFLRCELFDVKKAVERFLNYLILVDELWGFEVVSRRLVVKEDFTKNELQYLRKGFIQLLPFRDRSGRRVVALSDDPSETVKVSRNTRVRTFLQMQC